MTYFALVDDAKYQSSHFSCEDHKDDQKELERKKIIEVSKIQSLINKSKMPPQCVTETINSCILTFRLYKHKS